MCQLGATAPRQRLGKHTAYKSFLAGEASIRSTEKWDRSRNHSVHRGGGLSSTGPDKQAVRCLSVDPCCLAVVCGLL